MTDTGSPKTDQRMGDIEDELDALENMWNAIRGRDISQAKRMLEYIISRVDDEAAQKRRAADSVQMGTLEMIP